MSLEQMVPYKVKDAKNYKHQSKYKQITKINEKLNDFRFFNQCDLFQIQLLLSTPAIVTSVSMKVRYTNQVAIQFHYTKQQPYTQQVSLTSQQSAVGVVKLVKLQENTRMCDRIVVRFLNYPIPQTTLINHIILKGFKNSEQKKPLNKVKNVSNQDQFVMPTSIKKKVRENQKEIFNERNKQRQVRKTSVKELVEQIQQHKRFVTRHLANGDSYDQQLKKAMELSKRQMQQKNKQKQNTASKLHKKQQRQTKQVIQLDINDQQNQFFDYDLVEYDKVKHIYEHVTPEWVEAQRKAEQQRKIFSRHSLANRIKIKLFAKTDFCINNIMGSQRKRLIDLIKQLGGNIIDEPKNHCVIITNTMDGGKVALGKTLNDVKFVKPEYIDDCDKFKAKMDEKTYRAD